MRKELTAKIVFCSISLSLLFSFTLINIPFPGGFLNVGDAVLFLLSIMLPLPYAMLAAGVGSMLGDVTLGYFFYAPFTLVIKAVMALIIRLIVAKSDNKLRWGIAFTVASIFMQIGYFFTNAIILKGFMPAIATVPTNLIQSAVCIPLGILLSIIVLKIPFIKQKREIFFIKNAERKDNE